ncbi:hypothetical protein [Endobacterium cereale]|uniref:hypothetical protein n=1 Tax=Endobacterium cereale TaxID=2663029 RepID=UPI002B4591A7|nr:hypothetical protein [Endobacterium cereale]MEB2845889.1 hypothetical protein [Endobacterium cereale]
MGKFEIGQRLRVIDNITAPLSYKKGEVGIVEEIYHQDMVRLAGKSAGMFEHRFEPWVPKVGERVTTNKTTRVNIERHWNDHFRHSEGDIINGALVVTSVAEKNTGSNIGLSNKEGRSFFYMPESTLRPADPAPAALTIEAGKFYNTRDGRKVGPVTHNGHGVFGAPGFGSNRWYATGRSYSDAKTLPTDLIAEWVDEPKAGNDNGGVANLIGKSKTVQVTRPKFKVGDIVRRSNNYSLGRQLRIKEVINDDNYTAVWTDGGPGSTHGWRAHEFELVTPTPTTNPAIVCLIENGQPKPSTTPHIHADEAKAGKEAARLAGVYKGKEFGVFVLTSSTSQPAPVYKHEWQRQAAAGNKIGAIKELREIASLDLLSAKKAVEVFIEKAA